MSGKTGLLLYTPGDAERNRWFIEQLCAYAEAEGLSLRLCLVENSNPFIPFRQYPDAAFLINRSRFGTISDYAERSLHIPCFNSAYVTGITNYKYMTYLEMHCDHGIPMAKTQQISRKTPLPELTYPLVAKPQDGHGGEGVAWIENAEQFKKYCSEFDAAHPEPTYPFLVQEPVVPGWDVRVYVLGGEIYAAVLRTSETDFRSNFSLGGHAAVIEPDAEMRELVRRVQEIMPLDFAGVDILRRADGSYLLGEIEDAVGCRMLYQLTDKNPAKDFIAMISAKLHSRA